MAVLPYSDVQVVNMVPYILPYSDVVEVEMVPPQEEWYLPESAALIPGTLFGPP